MSNSSTSCPYSYVSADASNKTCQQDFGRKEVELGLETLASYRSTHSSDNIKKSKGLSIFGKNGNTKGFANPYIHAPLSILKNHDGLNFMIYKYCVGI